MEGKSINRDIIEIENNSIVISEDYYNELIEESNRNEEKIEQLAIEKANSYIIKDPFLLKIEINGNIKEIMSKQSPIKFSPSYFVDTDSQLYLKTSFLENIESQIIEEIDDYYFNKKNLDKMAKNVFKAKKKYTYIWIGLIFLFYVVLFCIIIMILISYFRL